MAGNTEFLCILILGVYIQDKEVEDSELTEFVSLF